MEEEPVGQSSSFQLSEMTTQIDQSRKNEENPINPQYQQNTRSFMNRDNSKCGGIRAISKSCCEDTILMQPSARRHSENTQIFVKNLGKNLNNAHELEIESIIQQETKVEISSKEIIDEKIEEQNEEQSDLGSLSFEDFKFSERKNEIDENRERKQIGVECIVPKIISQSEVFLLSGEIIFSLDMFDPRNYKKEHEKVSLWNKFKPIQSIVIKKNIIEVKLHNSSHALSECKPLIEKLLSLNDQKAYASAQMLLQYNQSLIQEKTIKEQVFQVYGNHFSHLQWQFEENFLKSKKQAEDIIKELPQESFYLYSIRRTDPATLDNIFWVLGYSKSLIRLMAGSESNYQQFSFRSGLVEFFDKRSLMEIWLMNLLVYNKAKMFITTLDDFSMPVETRVYYQKLQQTEILPGVFKEDYMKIYQILIEEKYLDQIHQLRGFSYTQENINSEQASRIVPPELDYQMKAHGFIKRFYSDYLNNKTKKSNNQSEIDPHNFTADFHRLFGNQNDETNSLPNVFNTTVKHEQSCFQNHNNNNNSPSFFQNDFSQNMNQNKNCFQNNHPEQLPFASVPNASNLNCLNSLSQKEQDEAKYIQSSSTISQDNKNLLKQMLYK